MTSTLRAAGTAAASALLLFALAACTGGAPAETPTSAETATVAILDSACADDAGVTIVVDSSALEDGESREWCIGTDEPVAAADALALVDVKTEGTDEYGDQVVCRVDGVPAEDAAIPAEDGSDYFETCASMPAAFAYWSLWQKAGRRRVGLRAGGPVDPAAAAGRRARAAVHAARRAGRTGGVTSDPA